MLQSRWKCKAIIFLHMCVNIWNGLYLVYMFWMDFSFFFSEFSSGFVFLKSFNSMLALLCSAHIFQHYKNYFAPHLKYNVFLLSDWKKSYLDSMTHLYQRIWMPISPKSRPVFPMIWKTTKDIPINGTLVPKSW